ncbi:zinc-ribbon domain-containing protein [Mycetohabitans sp. B46]|uniref:zinc-ribbon domain-containing protein n=1 Tax=Mycetohabitans sp. B46 TaxID=2772536 RepID=UPI00307DB83E
MTLATRCPRCGTVYRFVADQLKLHHDLVRGGHCQPIFDGAGRQVAPLLLTGDADEPSHVPGRAQPPVGPHGTLPIPFGGHSIPMLHAMKRRQRRVTTTTPSRHDATRPLVAMRARV